VRGGSGLLFVLLMSLREIVLILEQLDKRIFLKNGAGYGT
jgi:hypothetical protein